jgi:uncharacterized membrane protein YvbJ
MSENCPNCGAPKRGAVCRYCGTHFGRYQGQASVEIEQQYTDIYDWSGTMVYRIYHKPNVTVNINKAVD